MDNKLYIQSRIDGKMCTELLFIGGDLEKAASIVTQEKPRVKIARHGILGNVNQTSLRKILLNKKEIKILSNILCGRVEY